MTPNPPAHTPVSQGDREIRSVIVQKLFTITGDEIEQLIANYRAACVAEELTAKDAEIARWKECAYNAGVECHHLRAELASLKQSILDLSHPNLRLIMTDRDRAISELAKCKEDVAWLVRCGEALIAACPHTGEGGQRAIAAFDMRHAIDTVRAASEPKP